MLPWRSYTVPAVMVLVKREDENPRVGEVTCADGDIGSCEGVEGEGVTLSEEEGEGGVGGASLESFLFLLGRIVVWIMFLNFPTVGSTSSERVWVSVRVCVCGCVRVCG